MSNPDAVRPTGETGPRCPWCGSEMVLMLGPFMRTSRGNWHRASCRNNECSAEGPMVLADQDNFKEAEEAALAAAARPLPDSPAGAPGLPVDLEHVEQMMFNSRSDNCDPELLYKYWPEIVKEVRWHRDRLVCVNAPARPAAAGLKERDPANYIHPLGYTVPAAAGLTLTDAEREECVKSGLYERGRKVDIWIGEPNACPPSRDPFVPEDVRMIRAALAHAESILSSRATGAEVEIPEPSNDWFKEQVSELDSSVSFASTGMRERALMRRALEYARRHATMRTGGGE